MKPSVKKLLSLLLICIMALGMLPVTASAAENDLITGAYLDAEGTESAKVTKTEETISDWSGNALAVYDIAVPEGTEKVYVEYSGFTPSGSGDYYNADGSADYSTYFSTSETTPYLGVTVTSLLGTGKFLAVYNNSWTAVVALRFVVAEPELSYELRTLTFEDSDYKGGTNFAGKQDWSSLIDYPQYGGVMLYGSSGSGVSDKSEAYTWHDANNTELQHTISEAYGYWCYWTGGHAVSNYVSGDIETYGDYMNQLTVFKKGVTGLATTGGGNNGSNNFAMHFGYTDDSGYSTDVLPAISFADGVARVIDHMYVNNSSYAINCYVNGNDLTANISESDWVKIVATGYDAYGGTTTAEMYLCNGPDNIVMDWTKWDLTGLGAVTKVEFNITGSSDNGYGFSQPAYFAYDDLAVRFEKEPPVEVTGVTLDQAEAAVEVDSTVTLTATVEPENATDKTVKWSSSDETIATVADGVVTGVARGEATITVKAGKFEATCVVTVSNAVDATGVTLDKTELSMARWTSETLTATVSPEDANEKTVTWSSSDESIATVVDGVVTANCEGTAAITATTTDGGFTATCAVTVADTEKPDKDDDGYYIIDSAADLMWFAKHVNSVAGTNTDNAKMTCDIDLSTEVGSGLGNWVPIGDADVNASYGGTFDGGNFTISGMYYKNGTDKYAGLFGHTKGATVKNLTIANATFERSKSYAGAFIGFAENTTVENCHNSLYLKGIGSGNSYYAGIIGYAIDCTVRNSSNDGCGHNDCELAGSATICPQPGKIQGSANCGGIIGYAEGTTVVENCVNSGYVYGWGGGHNGGIIGKISGNAAITNCYNTGRMNTYASYAHVYIGGIAGHISSGASANITNCYSSGLLYVSSSLSASYKHIASIVALNDGTLIAENCYYLDTQAADENATAKTAEEMYDLANTLGTNYQTSCPTPVLTWQTAAEHNYVDGTCIAPKTCSVCGETEGEPNPDAHKYVDGVCEYCGVSAEAKPNPITNIEISHPNLVTDATGAMTMAMVTGASEQINVSTVLENAEQEATQVVAWFSSNESVATVDQTGKITALAAGTTTITAKAVEASGIALLADGEEVLAQFTLTVIDPTTGYTVTMGEDVQAVGNETVNIPVTIGHTGDVATFNAFDLTFKYDPAVLELTSNEIAGVTITDKDGEIQAVRYGDDLNVNTEALTLTFRAITTGETSVKVTAAKVDISESAQIQDAPDASIIDNITLVNVTGYTATLPDGFTGDNVAEPNKEYTFSEPDDNYDYDITVTVDGKEVEFTDNEDGTYTIPAESVTGEIVVSADPTPKSYNVDLGDYMSGETTATYLTDYTATLNREEGYSDEVTVTIGGEDYTGYTMSEDTWTIPGEDITGEIVFHVTRTQNSGGEGTSHTITFEGTGAGAAEGNATTAANGSDYTLTLIREKGYIYTVTAKTADGADVEVIANEDGTYTIKAVASNLVITIEKTLDLEGKVQVHEYVNLDGKTMFLVLVNGEHEDGKHYAYNDKAMYYSFVYEAYAYLTVETGSFTAEDAAKLVTIADGAKMTINKSYDVNRTNLVDINDAQLVYDIYNGKYDEVADLGVVKFLYADINGSKNVNVEDAVAIVDELLKAK